MKTGTIVKSVLIIGGGIATVYAIRQLMSKKDQPNTDPYAELANQISVGEKMPFDEAYKLAKEMIDSGEIHHDYKNPFDPLEEKNKIPVYVDPVPKFAYDPLPKDNVYIDPSPKFTYDPFPVEDTIYVEPAPKFAYDPLPTKPVYVKPQPVVNDFSQVTTYAASDPYSESIKPIALKTSKTATQYAVSGLGRITQLLL